jgi:hypothetical protein
MPPVRSHRQLLLRVAQAVAHGFSPARGQNDPDLDFVIQDDGVGDSLIAILRKISSELIP